MDPEIGKFATEVTEKVAESLAPTVIKKILAWGSPKKTPESKPRENKNRGSWERRNATKDRRVSSISERLLTGFCLEYCRKTGAGRYDVIALSRKTREDLFAALVTEAARYQFSDRSGKVLEPRFVIGSALDVSLVNWKQKPVGEDRTGALFEAVTSYLLLNFNVNNIDRRKQQRRQILPLAANGK